MVVWYKSKQFWFNVLAVVIAIAAGFGFDEFEADPATLLIAQLGIALINVLLRFAFPSKPPPPPATAKSATSPAAERYAILQTRVLTRNRLAAFWTVAATGALVAIAAALTQ